MSPKTNASVKADKTSNSWETKAKFESLTLWNHDSLPSQDDTFLRSFHWLTVANAKMGTQWPQEEEFQSSNPTGTTQGKQQLHNQDKDEKSVVTQSSKSTAMARELNLARNHEEQQLKKQPVSFISETNSRASGTKTDVKMPHNFETIVKSSDSPIDRSSVENFYEQLQAGVFLDQKRKKYWVEKRSNSNCFIIYAKDLLITWAKDTRYWRWYDMKETSDQIFSVAELQNVCWLEIHGSIWMEKLSPGILYEVVFLVMMKDPSYGWEVPVKLRLTFPDGKSQEHEENLMEKPKGRWIEIPVGELRTSTENSGDIQFSLYEYTGGLWKRGLLIKGVAIRPRI